jgi:hypothetical protein
MPNTVDDLIAEVKSKGVVASTVKDGTVFMFSRGTIEKLSEQLGTHEYVTLFVCTDPAKVQAAKPPVN